MTRSGDRLSCLLELMFKHCFTEAPLDALAGSIAIAMPSGPERLDGQFKACEQHACMRIECVHLNCVASVFACC